MITVKIHRYNFKLKKKE